MHPPMARRAEQHEVPGVGPLGDAGKADNMVTMEGQLIGLRLVVLCPATLAGAAVALPHVAGGLAPFWR